MEYNLTEGPVARRLLSFSWPILSANLLQAMYGTADLMIVGLFSTAASVSAVSTGSTSMHTVTGIITGMTMGCTVLLGQHIGQKNWKQAARTIGSALWFFLFLGVVLSFLLFYSASYIALWMNVPEEALGQSTDYLAVCGLGALFIVLFNAISGIFRGIGDSRTPLVLMGVACVCNIVMDLLLVGGMNMGAKGAAIATVAAQALSVLWAAFLIYKKGFGFPANSKDLRPARQETLRMLGYGLPIAAQEALTGISFMIILAILNGFGLVASAGVGVAQKICSLMFIVPAAMMSAISAFCAQNIGAGLPQRAWKGMLAGMVFSVGIGCFTFALGFLKGEWLASFFTTDPEVMKAAAQYLRSYGLDFILVGINFSMMGYLNGCGRTFFVAFQGIASTFLIRIPVAYVMSTLPGTSLFLIGWATPLATVFAILVTTIYLIWVKEHPHSAVKI